MGGNFRCSVCGLSCDRVGISMKVKCIKDTEGWWTEGEYYEAVESAGGFILVGDDVIDD